MAGTVHMLSVEVVIQEKGVKIWVIIDQANPNGRNQENCDLEYKYSYI